MSARSHCRTVGLAAALAGTTAALVACDAARAPTSLVVAAETEAALQVAEELPTLPWMVDRVERRLPALDSLVGASLAWATSLWTESLATGEVEPATVIREAAYDDVVPHLAERLSDDDLDEAHHHLRAWLAIASGITGGVTLDGIAERLAEGKSHLDAAMRARQTGRREAAVRATLYAADALVETTPRVVGLRLLAAAERELDAQPEVHNGDADLERAQRLLRGARIALEEGDHTLAIRRAYYARQLLGAR